MRTNALLVRWGSSPGGWTMVEDVVGLRIEATLGMGHIGSKVEAVRQAGGELDRFKAGQTELTIGIDPDGSGDVPYTDWGIGDLVTVDGEERRVIALTVAQDPERPGRLIYVPQIGDVIDSPAARMFRTGKKMSNGTLGGASRVATPLSPSQAPNPPSCCVPEYVPGEG